MKIIDEEKAQGSAEMILIFGGVIVIAIVAGIFYRNYLSGLGNEINTTDVENVTNSISNLKNLF